jgi:hypothetical protein
MPNAVSVGELFAEKYNALISRGFSDRCVEMLTMKKDLEGHVFASKCTK